MLSQLCYAYAAWNVGALAYDTYKIVASGFNFLRNVAGWSAKLLMDEKNDEKNEEKNDEKNDEKKEEEEKERHER
jgi:hypothetical protein